MIKILDIQKINLLHQKEIEEAILKVFHSGWYILGEAVQSFDKNFATYSLIKHCICIGNGLDALNLILRAYIEMGIMKEGDEVIVTANTYITTILSILQTNIIFVLVEPDINTYNICDNIKNPKITLPILDTLY